MNYNLISKKTSELTRQQKLFICKLKNQHWKFSLDEQKKWFLKNFKKMDIHNILIFKSKIIGYTALRRKHCSINKKKTKFLLFDTLIINKKFRNQKLSNILMIFNNYIIKKNKTFSFLVCKNNLVKFYEKHGWYKLKNKNFFTSNKKSYENGMIFNKNNLENKIKLFF